MAGFTGPGISVSNMKGMMRFRKQKKMSSRAGEQETSVEHVRAPPSTAHLFSCSTALLAFGQSGWADSNRRPSDPQSDALTKLRYSPCVGIINPTQYYQGCWQIRTADLSP